MTKIWLFGRGNDDNLHIVDRYVHTHIQPINVKRFQNK